MPQVSQIDEAPCQAEVRILQKITIKEARVSFALFSFKWIVLLINEFIEKRDWKLELKRTNVSSTFQTNNATDKGDYRPVSVLASMAELYEKVIYVQLCGYIRSHFSLNLSGFLKGHSCCSICAFKYDRRLVH